MRTGVIVAGGRSTRFGPADKVCAELAGTPMIRRVADRLVEPIDELVINCRTDQTERIDAALAGYNHEVRVAEDPKPDRGPMAGIHTGLRATTGEYAVVVAADMPFIEPALVSHLFARAAGHDAAVPRLDDGWLQTTHAVYCATAMADACEAALARGDRRTVAPLSALDCVVVGAGEVREHASLRSFENLNTREAFRAAADRLS